MLLPNLYLTLKHQHHSANSPAAAGVFKRHCDTDKETSGNEMSMAVLFFARAFQVFIFAPLPVLESLVQLPSHSKTDTSQMGN